MKSQIDFNYIKNYISSFLAKENKTLMPSDKVIDAVREYFIDYFGKENEGLIAKRLYKTDFSFVNENNAEKAAKRFIENCNNFHYIKKSNEYLSKDVTDVITENVNKVARLDGKAGYCLFLHCKDKNNGNRIDIRRGAFIGDVKDTMYENTLQDIFLDVNVCHELLHAVTQHIVNNCSQSGIDGYGNKEEMNEWLIDNMALEITRKLHVDGIRFNKKFELKESDFNTHRVLTRKLKAIPDGFFSNYKSILKPAILTGNFEELYDAFGDEKGLEKVAQGFKGYYHKSI